MIRLSSQTNELYQLASVAFCLIVAWCSDKLGLSLELGSFAAGVMISTTDLAQHTLEQVEPIRNFFAALFLASIGMLIHAHFLWNHIDILLAAVILVIIVKTAVVSLVVKGFGYTNKTSVLVGMSLAQIGEFAFVLLSRASNLHLIEGKLYVLLLGTTALSLVLRALDRAQQGLNCPIVSNHPALPVFDSLLDGLRQKFHHFQEMVSGPEVSLSPHPVLELAQPENHKSSPSPPVSCIF
ncbi:K(+) efflux antiporter 4-like [Olea europaea var. sylvestris]|uniref:K(+) efflux antiporter 4-like n=1 Tax=Olea europaea var. sylvestris TaxID=158386 RepID=UPI000C1D1DF1|nr:K(+) efflux antiporter 4-like [Olea europaea var. sylvestris]